MKIQGEETAVVESIEKVEDQGAAAYEITVRFEADDRVDSARVRADLVPEGLKAGDRVAVTKAALYRRWRIRIATNGDGS